VDGILTLNNSGDILGLGAKGTGSDGGQNNAEGVSVGGGSITNNATGQIIGSTTSTDAPNGNPTRAGNGILVDDSSGGNAVAAVTVTNSGLIQGKTGFAIKAVGTFGDTITNNAGGTIRGAGTGAAIQTGGGGDTITNRGAIVSDIGNAIDLEDGNDSLVVEGGGASVTGNISGGTGANTFTIKPGSGNSFAYSGTISNFSIVTVESGTVTFSGNNTYTGETDVTGGVLRLSGAGSLGTGDVMVASGAVLDITGISGSSFTIGSDRNLTVGGTIIATGKTLIAGGDVNPGASPGLMSVEGAFHLLDQGDLHLEVEGLNRGVTYDALTVTGLFTLDGSVIVTSDYVFAANDTLNLIDFGSIDASGFDLSNLLLPTLGEGLTWNTTSFTTDGTVSVVPEPSTGLLICGGSALLYALRRVRGRRA
jgi:autotransporter-associated beta strand protein